METLEQYGIKDVTPGNSEGMNEKMRGVFKRNGCILNVYKGNDFRGLLFGAKYHGCERGGQRLYNNGEGGIWLDEVRYD